MSGVSCSNLQPLWLSSLLGHEAGLSPSQLPMACSCRQNSQQQLVFPALMELPLPFPPPTDFHSEPGCSLPPHGGCADFWASCPTTSDHLCSDLGLSGCSNAHHWLPLCRLGSQFLSCTVWGIFCFYSVLITPPNGFGTKGYVTTITGSIFYFYCVYSMYHNHK